MGFGILVLGFRVLDNVRTIDMDLFHEMALIREALALGRIPMEDVFAQTSTVSPVVHHEWGTGAVLYFLVVGVALLGLHAGERYLRSTWEERRAGTGTGVTTANSIQPEPPPTCPRTTSRAIFMNPFGVGAYVSWQLHPDVKVGMDSRYEVAFAPELAEETMWIYQGDGDWREFLD